jgi:hypothetical protein
MSGPSDRDKSVSLATDACKAFVAQKILGDATTAAGARRATTLKPN